jgi:hypothetical protein
MAVSSRVLDRKSYATKALPVFSGKFGGGFSASGRKWGMHGLVYAIGAKTARSVAW